MNPVAMNIINPWKELLTKLGVEPVTSCSQVHNATDWAMGLSEFQNKTLYILAVTIQSSAH